jgi:hypothetical protein
MIKKTAARFTLGAVPVIAAVALLAGCAGGVEEAETATDIAKPPQGLEGLPESLHDQKEIHASNVG